MKHTKTVLVLALTFTVIIDCAVSGASSLTSRFIQTPGSAGNYRIVVNTVRGSRTLYVVKGNSRTRIDSGDIGTRVVAASGRLFYTKGRKLIRCSMKGNHKNVIDRECKSSNDAGMKIVAYAGGDMYYSKAADKSFEKMNVYRYSVKGRKKELFTTREFSYNYCMDTCNGYKYSYDEPSDLAGQYVLSVSKYADNSETVLASNVSTHKFIRNKIYYMTTDVTKGTVSFERADLDGGHREVLSAFDYKAALNGNADVNEITGVSPQKLTESGASFYVYYLDKKGAEHKSRFATEFATGKTVTD